MKEQEKSKEFKVPKQIKSFIWFLQCRCHLDGGIIHEWSDKVAYCETCGRRV